MISMKSTHIFTISESNFSDIIKDCAYIINNGGTVAIPTETVYGLGANAFDVQAVQKIFDAKGRPADNPLIVHISSMEQLRQIVLTIPEKASQLINKFWPGPLTLILKKTSILPLITTGHLDTVAVRMPSNRIAFELIKAAKVPIAAPSSNTSGKPSPTTAMHVYNDLNGKIDAIIDGGDTIIGVESTVIDLTPQIPILLRPGFISSTQISDVIGKVECGYSDKNIIEGTVRSPGMKYTHYSPDAQVVLVEGDHEKTVIEIKKLYIKYNTQNKKVGILVTDKDLLYLTSYHFYLGNTKETTKIAYNLFKGLRTLDDMQVDIIIADGSFLQQNVGIAVMNRLKKAATYIVKL